MKDDNVFKHNSILIKLMTNVLLLGKFRKYKSFNPESIYYVVFSIKKLIKIGF